ncbi:hypothetical protein AC578_1838 [Pseudocercospora eumusae]|uniref:Uncharacterized protein n=1 Tax=Pseudocercospora eumusae TaxID=321146 RepID=A0A139HK61_9PEZI|nr:hypothetical protein AC578_1838 [Pseudocercospora eumusae]
MDPARRPQLPAISYLADGDKPKREDDAYPNRHPATGTPQSLSASAGASPTYHYPQAPPAPYAHAHAVPPTNTWPSASVGVHTPPESRRTSENEKDAAKQRQSLPSISEALGIDRQTSIAADPPPPLQPTHLTQTQATTASSSPTPSTRRSFPMEPPQASQPPYPTTGSTFSQYPHYRSESQQPSYPPPSETSRPAPTAYPPVTEPKPPLQLQTSQPTSRPPPSTTFVRPAEPSPAYEQSNATSTGSMGQPFHTATHPIPRDMPIRRLLQAPLLDQSINLPCLVLLSLLSRLGRPQIVRTNGHRLQPTMEIASNVILISTTWKQHSMRLPRPAEY